jgi:hypothetical protein
MSTVSFSANCDYLKWLAQQPNMWCVLAFLEIAQSFGESGQSLAFGAIIDPIDSLTRVHDHTFGPVSGGAART